mmetsp:Transcript_6622/g.27028  ORF Transcript_6622/g.27028 Transcript_6622/m.27028 type:complete len:208 (-) Transcript_6622:1522-2145(-)
MERSSSRSGRVSAARRCDGDKQVNHLSTSSCCCAMAPHAASVSFHMSSGQRGLSAPLPYAPAPPLSAPCFAPLPSLRPLPPDALDPLGSSSIISVHISLPPAAIARPSIPVLFPRAPPLLPFERPFVLALLPVSTCRQRWQYSHMHPGGPAPPSTEKTSCRIVMAEAKWSGGKTPLIAACPFGVSAAIFRSASEMSVSVTAAGRGPK